MGQGEPDDVWGDVGKGFYDENRVRLLRWIGNYKPHDFQPEYHNPLLKVLEEKGQNINDLLGVLVKYKRVKGWEIDQDSVAQNSTSDTRKDIRSGINVSDLMTDQPSSGLLGGIGQIESKVDLDMSGGISWEAASLVKVWHGLADFLIEYGSATRTNSGSKSEYLDEAISLGLDLRDIDERLEFQHKSEFAFFQERKVAADILGEKLAEVTGKNYKLCRMFVSDLILIRRMVYGAEKYKHIQFLEKDFVSENDIV